MGLIIAVNKLQSQEYEWRLLSVCNSQLQSGVAQSLAASLADAAYLSFDGIPLRSIKYRGVCIGTLSAEVIVEHPDEVAAWIMSKYVCSLA